MARQRPERFHGAFTGGFSAGHFNTVGSAEGWAPSSFSSSRSKRADVKKQRVEDFMDEDDGLGGGRLQARSEFDTLGSTAADVAKRRGAAGSSSAVPQEVSDALFSLTAPPGDSIGFRLLRAMGWREGQGIGSRTRRKLRHVLDSAPGDDDEALNSAVADSVRKSLGEARAREVFGGDGMAISLARDNEAALLAVPKPKNDLYGIGYQPFRDAPEFAAAAAVAASSADGSGRAAKGARPAVARGTHGFALDDDEEDVYNHEEAANDAFAFDAAVDVAPALPRTLDGRRSVLEVAAASFGAPPSSLSATQSRGAEDAVERPVKRLCATDGRSPPAGFVVGSQPRQPPRVWTPAAPPSDWSAVHRFSAEEEAEYAQAAAAVGIAAPQQRTLTTAAQRRGIALGEAPPPPPPPPPSVPLVLAGHSAASGRAAVAAAAVAGLRSAMASKFTSAGGTGSAAAAAAAQVVVAADFPPAGLTQPSLKAKEGASSGAAAAASLPPLPPPPPSSAGDAAAAALAAKRPERTSLPWRPAPLLCKRFNVPVPDASKEASWLVGGAAAAASAAVKREQQTFDREIGQFLPSHIVPGLHPPPPLAAGLDHLQTLSGGAVSSNGGASTLRRDDEQEDDDAGEEEPPPPPKPPIDLFKSIFEASDSEEEESSEGEDEVEGEGGGKAEAASNGGAASAAARDAEGAETPPPGDSNANGAAAGGGGPLAAAAIDIGSAAAPQRPVFVPRAKRIGSELAAAGAAAEPELPAPTPAVSLAEVQVGVKRPSASAEPVSDSDGSRSGSESGDELRRSRKKDGKRRKKEKREAKKKSFKRKSGERDRDRKHKSHKKDRR